MTMRKTTTLILLYAILIACQGPLSGSKASAECLTNGCHASIKKIGTPHAPVADGDCLECHKQTNKTHPIKGGKSFVLSAKIPSLCYRCHERFQGARFHEPVSEGECITCHNPHGGKDRYLLDNAQDLTSLCAQCHDEPSNSAKVIHGPTAAGACGACHDIHASDFGSLLKKSPKVICFSCHLQMEREMKGAAVLHDPLKDANCRSCHEPHESAFRALLKMPLAETCTECHTDIKAFKRVRNKHVVLLKESSCSACHNPHYSREPNLLDKQESELCLSCHGRDDNKRRKGLRNIKKEIAQKRYLHGPIQKGRCSPCHDPHGSNYYRMLFSSYPDGFYAPYKKGLYDFCLKCHEENMLRFRDTSVYTKFRNGKLNLHYVHVVKERKGRTCRTCHASHASNNPKLIDDAVPFGEWAIPIRFVPTETGGSCSPGCHRPLRYDRRNPVEY